MVAIYLLNQLNPEYKGAFMAPRRISQVRSLICALLMTLNAPPVFAAQLAEGPPNPSDIRIVRQIPTPEPGEVRTVIEYPEPDAVIEENPITSRIRVSGFPVSTESYFSRRKEIRDDPRGQSIHIFIDNQPYFSIYKSSALFDAMDNHELYYRQTFEFDLPFALPPGMHVMQAIPCRSYGESLKAPRAADARVFFFKDKTPNPEMDINAPFLTYNEPQGTFKESAQPILLDFYLTNCQLSRDGYKVLVTVNGNTTRVLTLWLPYFIYGLKKGTHTIRLQLIDAMNKKVPGLFNDTERTITIE